MEYSTQSNDTVNRNAAAELKAMLVNGETVSAQFFFLC